MAVRRKTHDSSIGSPPWTKSPMRLSNGSTPPPGRTAHLEEFSIASGDAGARDHRVRFSEDVAAGLKAADSHVAVDGMAVDPSKVKFSYDPATRTATWIVETPAGLVRFTLDGDAVHDAAGQALDGNQDGLEGGDFVREVTVAPGGE